MVSEAMQESDPGTDVVQGGTVSKLFENEVKNFQTTLQPHWSKECAPTVKTL